MPRKLPSLFTRRVSRNVSRRKLFRSPVRHEVSLHFRSRPERPVCGCPTLPRPLRRVGWKQHKLPVTSQAREFFELVRRRCPRFASAFWTLTREFQDRDHWAGNYPPDLAEDADTPSFRSRSRACVASVVFG